MTVLVAQYDGGSRVPRAAPTPPYLGEVLGKLVPDAILPREMGEHANVLAGEMAYDAVRRHVSPFIIGGDHSITFHVALSIARLVKKFSIVHFDAHHDCYRSNALNNYTFMHHIKRLSQIQVFGVGYRYESQASNVLDEELSGPVYVSFDADYFDPRQVKCVGHPVEVVDGRDYGLQAVARSLRAIRGPIIGVDFVEWCPSEALSGDESETIANLLEMLHSHAGRRTLKSGL